MRRYFLISALVHLFVLSFIWVGFSVPNTKNQNSFTYLGELITVPQEYARSGSVRQDGGDLDTAILGEHSSSMFGPWLKMRQVEKPR